MKPPLACYANTVSGNTPLPLTAIARIVKTRTSSALYIRLALAVGLMRVDSTTPDDGPNTGLAVRLVTLPPPIALGNPPEFLGNFLWAKDGKKATPPQPVKLKS